MYGTSKRHAVAALGALMMMMLGGCGGGAEPEAARVNVQPSSVSVRPGDSARFEAQAQGTPPLQYQWRRNGLDIPGANGLSYVAPPAASEESADEYDVLVSNEAGSDVSEPALLLVGEAATSAAVAAPSEARHSEPADRAEALAAAVKVAPGITVQPVGVLANPRQTATFTVIARGTAPLSYQWRRNNVAIAGATRASYTTPPLALSNNGSVYSVVVRNAVRSVSSARATVTVTSSRIAPAFAVQPASVNVAVGKAATFSVRTTGSAPAYQWFRNGRRLPGATGASYTLAKPALADSGALFSVQASNRAGTLTSRYATLTVGSARVAPRIAAHPAALLAKLGATASFDVLAIGTPPFSYQWRRNGVVIPRATAARYSVAASADQHGAAFSVVVRNAAGSVASRAAVLSVATASQAASVPTLLRHPSAARAAPGAAATFTVAASGVAPVGYQWLRNGTAILGATNPSYTTGRLAASDDGAVFAVNVRNPRGTVRSRPARLSVTTPSVPGTSGSYFVAGLSSTALGQDVLNIVDPDSPTPVALSVPFNDYGFFQLGVASQMNAATRSGTLLGFPMTYYLKDGQLFQIALAKSGTPKAVRVSSVADACRIPSTAEIDSTGLDNWLILETAGQDGNCRTPADNLSAFVRTSTPATVPATTLPLGVKVVLGRQNIHALDGRLQWMLAIDSTGSTPKLVAYGPTLTRIDVTGGAGVASVYMMNASPLLADGIFLRADKQLRRLTGNAAVLSLSPSVHAFEGGGPLGLFDKPWLYFSDNEKVFKVQASGTPALIGSMDPAFGNAINSGQTPGYLVFQQSAKNGLLATSSVAKSSGAVVRLLTSDLVAIVKQPVGLAGMGLFYYTGTNSVLGSLRRLQLDGSNDELVIADVAGQGFISPRVASADFTGGLYNMDGWLYCQPLPGVADCRSGMLMQVDLANVAHTALGRYGSAVTQRWAHYGGGFSDLKGGVMTTVGSGGTPSLYVRDMYVFHPRLAGSLKRVTTLVP